MEDINRELGSISFHFIPFSVMGREKNYSCFSTQSIFHRLDRLQRTRLMTNHFLQKSSFKAYSFRGLRVQCGFSRLASSLLLLFHQNLVHGSPLQVRLRDLLQPLKPPDLPSVENLRDLENVDLIQEDLALHLQFPCWRVKIDHNRFNSIVVISLFCQLSYFGRPARSSPAAETSFFACS